MLAELNGIEVLVATAHGGLTSRAKVSSEVVRISLAASSMGAVGVVEMYRMK